VKKDGLIQEVEERRRKRRVEEGKMKRSRGGTIYNHWAGLVD